MAEDKRYYWVKLDFSRFENGGDLDFLMGQKNGAEYVVLYMMLCLNTRNTQGEFISKLGDVMIPFDIDKIVRDCKFFSRDTVMVALELYKRLGLVFEQENGILKIANFDKIVGSETAAAERMRRMRQAKSVTMLQDCYAQCSEQDETSCYSNVTQEIRDKSIRVQEERVKKEEVDESLRSSSCPEPSRENSEHDSEKQEPFITLPVIGGETVEVSEEYVGELEALYLAIDVRQEIRNAKAWLISNPTRVKKDWKRFLNNWLARSNDRARFESNSARKVAPDYDPSVNTGEAEKVEW